ncbi:hypothetical protein C1S86_24385 [Vibrio parahaemolyticus]|uniref:hypothetical protein n=1 Tax=Vibrio parahaemolyticus TaxID=670 RepID=UPI000C8790A3|nr:hypothetical protein [Vibrio parahaemolyticus]PMT73895.1 hypothetical protein C1S97_25305 [Vibrio parahaemolyticus]PMT79095.1 hypothetical protein C1S86_24385 [Vibrio parahaemolyticus]
MNKLTFPQAANNIHTQASDFISQLKDHVTSQSAKLDALKNPLHTQSELAANAAGLLSLRDELNNLLFDGHAIAFTPYQYRIGTENRLSADNAAKFAAKKLTEQYDPISGQHGLAIFITASTESDFANKISTISKLLPFPEWIALSDMATKHAVLTIEKMQIPPKRLNPYWREDDYSNQAPLSTSDDLIGAELAQAEAIAENATSPVARLKSLASIQTQQLDQLSNDITAFIALFTGECYAMRLTGTTSSMATQLRDASISSEPYSTLFLMVSKTEPIFFYQMVDV